ncbi:MAG: hypothetical protein LBN96_01640 [Desulfovibrio sp.]|jgi:endogenous inhibitor of DNA gyrase (YacG/DUF329 family)|nr:hypothetical protein [Desulfovibrio sp.]
MRPCEEIIYGQSSPVKRSPALCGHDPELLYVECGSCGAPVMWGEGRATRILAQAGIDPLELDSSCLLVTDACPMCSNRTHYSVQIFRVSNGNPPQFGTA